MLIFSPAIYGPHKIATLKSEILELGSLQKIGATDEVSILFFENYSTLTCSVAAMNHFWARSDPDFTMLPVPHKIRLNINSLIVLLFNNNTY